MHYNFWDLQASVRSAFLERGKMESVGQINAGTQFIKVRWITNVTFVGLGRGERCFFNNQLRFGERELPIKGFEG